MLSTLRSCFSRHKDRVSSTTRLTPLESVRFKRGMYRFWLFCECYSPPEYDHGDDDRQAAKDRAANEYLRLLNTEDLFEVAAAATFCSEMCEWNHKARSWTHNTSLRSSPTCFAVSDPHCIVATYACL